MLQNLHSHLLGRQVIEALDLVFRVSVIHSDKNSPVVHYPSISEGLGKLEGEDSIQLEAKP